MPYWTHGVVTFHAFAKKISVNPTSDYQVIHQNHKYTIFLTENGERSKVFRITRTFEIDRADPSLETSLRQSAFGSVCLAIAINDERDPKVTEVVIPAKPKSP